MLARGRLRPAFDEMSGVVRRRPSLAAPSDLESRFAWKHSRKGLTLTELVRPLVWLVPLAAGVLLAHGCLNPQPTAPARDEAGSSGSGDGATATTAAAEGASATTSLGSGNTTGGGIQDGAGGTVGTGSGAPNEGVAGAGGEAGASGLDQGGAPPDHD